MCAGNAHSCSEIRERIFSAPLSPVVHINLPLMHVSNLASSTEFLCVLILQVPMNHGCACGHSPARCPLLLLFVIILLLYIIITVVIVPTIVAMDLCLPLLLGLNQGVDMSVVL